jgi:hypothetical protein
MRPEGLSELKKSPHWFWNTRPSGLWHSAVCHTLNYHDLIITGQKRNDYDAGELLISITYSSASAAIVPASSTGCRRSDISRCLRQYFRLDECHSHPYLITSHDEISRNVCSCLTFVKQTKLIYITCVGKAFQTWELYCEVEAVVAQFWGHRVFT